MAKKFSQFPFASSISPGDSVVGLKGGANTRFSFATVFSYIQALFVPTSRKVNNKALTSDISLDASDVGAVDTADVGVADGVASLDSAGKVPGNQLDLSGKQSTIIASGILKGDGQGGVSAATPGTDYATPAQLASLVLKTASAFSLPASGSSVSKDMSGLTADHELIRWNFYDNGAIVSENQPPADLTWTTYAGYFTITNNGGSTTATIQPVFAIPSATAISNH